VAILHVESYPQSLNSIVSITSVALKVIPKVKC
jgi:hypothetical protein